ncbi:3-oxoacyl-ACP reductase [Microbulbifer flavimaris]|uniref:3-oxoacyl-ACP reductase n=1 Tax=Microbulbifer flavimaris TaxID=1781068 RepID=A0ABX4I2C3_9GAMM|nr:MULTISPECIES: 3-oxoacyl-ACP reductase [Microbulbifer]KUJ84187.1 3-ketoacyl-ACP reductase [Microbulbifer sp. ZGT114]PCO06261.1 3-oxoacyl-ACP reductase [Microbulbifer flavimaris]
MSDLLKQLNSNPLTGWLAKTLGLPNPVTLLREEGAYTAELFQGKTAVLATSSGGYVQESVRTTLEQAGATIKLTGELGEAQRPEILVVDATGLQSVEDYTLIYEQLQPLVRRIAVNGRVLMLAPPPEQAESVVASGVARGLEGFSRSLGKELGPRGITVNLAYVAPDAADRLDMVLRFFCGPQTAYVSGQTITVTAKTRTPGVLPREQLLAGKVALVTGAARGIGLATARRLHQEGATVIGLDIPAADEELQRVCKDLGATPLALDISASDAPQRLVKFIQENFGGLDILVHNAGITRDKTLGKMPEHFWQQVMQVNLAAIIAIDEALLNAQLIRDCGRLVYLSSMSGVAGNFGQTNYATTKAALIGYVAALGSTLSERGICANAVAPGFIETAMTDAMPFFTREAGRRLNSLKQGGQPRDVAELIGFLSSPGAVGVNGNTIRVCGQGLIGA